MTKEEIRALRKSLKLTQKEFGLKIEVSAVTVRFWEHGRRTPSKQSIKLMKQIKVSK